MNEHAYEPSFNAAAPAAEAYNNGHPPDYAPPAPPRMRIVAGEGGLGVMFGALAKAQSNFKAIKADAHVQVDTREKGSYKFAYAPLENVLAACVPALNAEGFFFSQPLYSANDGEGYVLRTCLMHASGGMLEVETYIPKPAGRIQDLGSAITYQRRYVAQALFGVNSEDDDDGAQASGDKRTVQPPRAPQPSAAPPQQRPAATNGKPEVKTVGGPAPAMPTNPPAAQTTISSHGHDRAEAAGTIAPKASTTHAVSPAQTAEAAAGTPPAAPTATADTAPANEVRVERPFTPEQDTELTDLFAQVKKLGAKLSAPAVNSYIQRLTGKQGSTMLVEDAAAVIADLKQRIAARNIDFSPPRAS